MDILNEITAIALGTAISTASAPTSALRVSQATIDFSNILWEYLSLLGVCLTIVFFIVELNKVYAFERNDMTIKSVFLPFLKLMIAIVVLSQASTVVGAYLGWHNKFVEWGESNITASTIVTSTVTDTDTTAEKLSKSTNVTINGVTYNTNTIAENLANGMNFWGKIIMILVSVISLLVSFVLQFVWIYKGYVFQFELLFRIAITPVALADVYSGHNANAFRWLKGFIALSLYAIAFVFIPRVSLVIASGTLITAMNDISTSPTIPVYIVSIFSFIIAPIASIGVLSTAKELSKEVIV